MRTKISGCLLVLVLTGCTLLPSTSTPYSTPTKDLTPTKYVMPGETNTPLIPIPTATIRVTRSSPTLTPMVIPTTTPTTLPAQEVKVPSVVKVCPEQQVVPFKELELPSDTRLLVMPLNTGDDISSPQMFSPGDPNPKEIPNVTLEFGKGRVSPDHRWILFYLPGEDVHQYMIWVSSLDGKKQWPVIQISFPNYPTWVSDQEIYIIGAPDNENHEPLEMWEYMPILSINPFTMEQRTLTYIANEKLGRFYYGSVSIMGHSYAMIGRLNRVDYLYDYINEKELPVFHWLDEVDPFKLQRIPPVWVYDGDKFAVTVARSDGIDLALALDIHSAGEDKPYNAVMMKILMPEYLLPLYMYGFVPGKDMLALSRYGYISEVGGPSWFYILDFNNMVIKDYCFSIPGPVMPPRFSPDGRFAAFTIEDQPPSLDKTKNYIVILDLDMGIMAFLDGYSVLDWGVMIEQ